MIKNKIKEATEEVPSLEECSELKDWKIIIDELIDKFGSTAKLAPCAGANNVWFEVTYVKQGK